MSTKTKEYRKDIDGLRGFAVIAVIIYHFNDQLLPGGFLGVDIFFVISGFVITLSLAIVVAVGIKVVGVLLIIALLIIPAASARSVASSPESMGIIAAVIGILASILGLNSAYLFDTPTGPSIVCVASLFFFILMTVNVVFKNKI